ncbi:hypothetical protein ABH984_004680 [Bradyrhizobium ottawaense]
MGDCPHLAGHLLSDASNIVGTGYAVQKVPQPRVKTIQRRLAWPRRWFEFQQESLGAAVGGELKLLRSDCNQVEKRVFASRQPPTDFLAKRGRFLISREQRVIADIEPKQSASVRALLQYLQGFRFDHQKRAVRLNCSRDLNGLCGTLFKIAVIQLGHWVMPS